MLELRPTCELCNKDLPLASTQAMICSLDCTLGKDCAQGVFGNVCPNCGGGLCARTFRPARNWNGDNYPGKYPASTPVKHTPTDLGIGSRDRPAPF